MVALRPRGSDDLGLRQALSGFLLPLLVAAMVFLAAIAAAGAIAAAELARHWRGGAGSLVTVQVPQPDAPAEAEGRSRADAVAAALASLQGAAARRLDAAELRALLRPWVGDDADLPVTLPAVFEVRLADAGQGSPPPAAQNDLAARLQRIAPGTLCEQNGAWSERLALLGSSLQASAALALLTVTFVAAAVIALATRAGLLMRREAVEIVHGLGATDGLIAGRFAGRMTLLVSGGALLGIGLVLPVLLGLAWLSAPFSGVATQPPPVSAEALIAALPAPLWAVLPALPVLAGAIGWLTAQMTVRSWLARLP